MFEGEMRIEVERRLQAACDDRARAGLPPPVSIDALRGIVRSDLIEEIEARRVAQKAAVKPAPAAAKPAVVPPPILPRQAPAPEPPKPPKATGMALLLEMAAQSNRSEPVLPPLRNPPRAPARRPAVDPDEMAAQSILEAGRIARNG